MRRAFLGIAASAAILASAAGWPRSAAGAETGPGPRDRCPVCGMFVAKYPEWLAAVRVRDGSVAWFDGPKDALKYLRDPARRRTPRENEVLAIRVTDYYSVTLVDAEAAWFVMGSDVLGPMGRELVPFAREHEAIEFARDHGATTILRFREITAAVLEALE